MFVFDASTPFERRHEQPVVFCPGPRPGPVSTDAPTLTEETIRRLDHLHGELDRRSPFRVSEQLIQEARRLVDDHDDPRSSIAATATACEVMIDDLLACMLWEEGRRPEQFASLFEQPLVRRLRSSHFRSRLRGDWGVDSDGPVGQWVRRVVWRRNNMLHTGEEMTLADADDAFDAAFGLLVFIRSELLDAADRFGRTAWMLLGAPNVPDSIRDDHIEPLLADPNETKWSDSSAHWIRVMRYSRKHGEWSRAADPDDLAFVAVVHPDRHIVWVAVDERLERGLVLKDPSTWLSDAQRDAMARIEAQDAPFTSRMEKPPESQRALAPLPVDDAWVAAYRLLPGRPAMVTGDQLDYVARHETGNR